MIPRKCSFENLEWDGTIMNEWYEKLEEIQKLNGQKDI